MEELGKRILGKGTPRAPGGQTHVWKPTLGNESRNIRDRQRTSEMCLAFAWLLSGAVWGKTTQPHSTRMPGARGALGRGVPSS